MLPRRSLKIALAAGLAGLLAGYVSHRSERRARAFALLQAADWFMAAGGGALLTDLLRRALAEAEDAGAAEVTERFVQTRQAVVERSPER